MTTELAPLDEVGSLAWLARTAGHLDRRERAYLLRGIYSMMREGFRLRRSVKRAKRSVALDPFEPPDTPMVHAATEYLVTHSRLPMINHSYRTAFWTLVVLDHKTGVTEQTLETTWVAALLHDVGLDVPPEHGDFSAGGVQVLEQLADKHAWSADHVREAGEAIAVNLSTRVQADKVGDIAWAMNAGGAGELGIWPHRAQMARSNIKALEKRYPRDGFRKLAMELIRDEAKRIPDGRFAAFKWVYWLLMR